MGVFSFNLGGPGARWCANVGRRHRSNFVYWVADVWTGRTWQKCFDRTDCVGFKGPVVQLPGHWPVAWVDRSQEHEVAGAMVSGHVIGSAVGATVCGEGAAS